MVMEKPSTKAYGRQAIPPLNKVLPPPSGHTITQLGPTGPRPSQARATFKSPGHQDQSQSQCHWQNEHKPNPSRTSSFLPWFASRTTIQRPLIYLIHLSVCPSIWQSTCPSIHSSLLLIGLVMEDGQGMGPIALSVALAPWPKVALARAGHSPRGPYLGDSLSKSRWTWPGADWPGDWRTWLRFLNHFVLRLTGPWSRKCFFEIKKKPGKFK